jgi:steroid delta-isomerase-like uncharacterized protein
MRFIVLVALVACSAPTSPPRSTMSESNKLLVRRLYDEYVNTNRVAALGDLISDDLVNGDGTRGPSGFAAVMTRLRGAFPDLEYTVEDLIAEDDRVVVRWTLRGTHTGVFRGLAPTGKKVVNDGMAVFRIANGKIVHATVQTDRLGFLLSIGRIEYDPSFGPPPRAD